jgi:hypothetical protein
MTKNKISAQIILLQVGNKRNKKSKYCQIKTLHSDGWLIVYNQ